MVSLFLYSEQDNDIIHHDRETLHPLARTFAEHCQSLRSIISPNVLYARQAPGEWVSVNEVPQLLLRLCKDLMTLATRYDEGSLDVEVQPTPGGAEMLEQIMLASQVLGRLQTTGSNYGSTLCHRNSIPMTLRSSLLSTNWSTHSRATTGSLQCNIVMDFVRPSRRNHVLYIQRSIATYSKLIKPSHAARCLFFSTLSSKVNDNTHWHPQSPIGIQRIDKHAVFIQNGMYQVALDPM